MRPLVILRPEPGASATAERARAMGLTVRRYSLFAVEPAEWTLPDGRFDGLLLTSANAVRHAGDLPRLPVYAVGEATAAAARDAGAEVASVGTGGVEALLATLDPRLRLLHLAGEDRMVPDTQGPTITAVTVYRTSPLSLPSAELVQDAVLLVHSPAAGRRVDALACDRARVRIAAISPAAAEVCGEGWAEVAAALQPSDATLLSLAAKLCKTTP